MEIYPSLLASALMNHRLQVKSAPVDLAHWILIMFYTKRLPHFLLGKKAPLMPVGSFLIYSKKYLPDCGDTSIRHFISQINVTLADCSVNLVMPLC